MRAGVGLRYACCLSCGHLWSYLFGWCTKEMLQANQSRIREHPMHDSLLDG